MRSIGTVLYFTHELILYEEATSGEVLYHSSVCVLNHQLILSSLWIGL